MTVALAGCTSHKPAAPSPARVTAQQLARSGATSVIVFDSDHGHSTVATAGKPPPAAGQRFRIGSVTKTFTAALVLQLVDQNRIGLDDPVGRYLPGVIPAGGKITIRELLPCGRFWGHSGSILDYQTLVNASGNGARVAVISVRGPIAHPPDDSVLLCPSRGSTVHAAVSRSS